MLPWQPAMDGFNGLGTPRNIPLICTVCPESPRFSDVSHLLTHIASKGHLHHETQTKLRAHQDLVAAVTLQQYEQWYHKNGIEALLVERLKAKQVKEAMKGRIHRANVISRPTNVAPRTKKRSRRATNETSQYVTQNFTETIPIYPGLFSEENDSEIPDELQHNDDMLSLKGQIWPGMGKMDLANEDMKRTRNQRKPKSAIDKMRRTSEGIEPTQVVMTSDLQVERVKGVYDSSSPIIGQEDATPPPPKRPARARKKREPLADLSTNVPVGHPDQANSNRYTRPGQPKKQTPLPESLYTTALPLRQTIRSHGIYQDGKHSLDVYDDRNTTQPTRTASGHHGMPTFNPISQSASALATRIAPSKAAFSYSQESLSGLPDLRHYSFSSNFSHCPDTPNSLNLSAFGGASRYALTMNSHFSAYDRSQSHDTHPITPKQEDYFSLAGQTSLLNSSPNFLNLSESNPLLSQDQQYFKSYLQSPNNKSHEQANTYSSFKPINYRSEDTESTANADAQDISAEDIKVESQLCEIVHPSLQNDDDQPDLEADGTWGADALLGGLAGDLAQEDSVA
ncbi:hypothetical protein NLG97_g5950 [Lecanicillium saksenae]|uniref:Uncharacterized protein n=1 Tax=Lecanicillium saksenae TaxID=468837 RepID=A0ACC1QU75_9HYPO|nr:hypothetical protein NLG97_g5950 [Lecanicillium saksenae]